MKWDFGREFGFGYSGLSLFDFLFPLVRCRTGEDTKFRFVTETGDCFTPPGSNQVIITFLLYSSLLAILHVVQILSGPKNPLFFFSIFLSLIFD